MMVAHLSVSVRVNPPPDAPSLRVTALPGKSAIRHGPRKRDDGDMIFKDSMRPAFSYEV